LTVPRSTLLSLIHVRYASDIVQKDREIIRLLMRLHSPAIGYIRLLYAATSEQMIFIDSDLSLALGDGLDTCISQHKSLFIHDNKRR